MMSECDANTTEVDTTDENVISALTDSLTSRVNVSSEQQDATEATEPAISSMPPPSAMPTQLGSPLLVGNIPPASTPLLMPTLSTPAPISACPSPAVTQSPVPGIPLYQSRAPPTPMMPMMSQMHSSPPVGPPPTAGFQPVSHAVAAHSHHIPPVAQLPGPTSQSSVADPVAVNIFTPASDPSAASPYNNPAQFYSAPPGVMDMPHEGGNSFVQVGSGYTASQYSANVTAGHSGHDQGIIQWLKTNETVHAVLQKAKIGVESVITTMDPGMRDVIYGGGDIDIMVTSSKAVKVEPVKEAFQKVFGRATVFGRDSQPNVAPQPVGFTSGIKGAEQRIENLLQSGQINQQQVCVAIESFIVDLQPDSWYDIACLMLRDPVNNITIQTFSQPTPVNLEYVQQAQSETGKDFPLSWSGFAVTVGQVMHRQCAVNPSDWHYYFSGISRKETLLMAAKQLAYMYKQRLPSHH